MIYKRGQRYRLKAEAVLALMESQNLLAFEHEQLESQGFGLPRITVSVAQSGLATVRATWRMKISEGNIAHRMVLRGLRLA